MYIYQDANRLHTGLSGRDTAEVPRHAPKLKYMEVADDLRRRIASGRFKAGTVIPGQRQLADELDVSRESVRRAMELLEEEGVLKCLPSVGCVVETRQDTMVRVGYLVSDLADPFHAGIIRELDAALVDHHGALLVGEGHDPSRVLDAGAAVLVKQHYIGCEHPADPPGTVYIGGGEAGRHIVRSADRQGIRLAYDHLRGLGHERIAYYGPRLPEGTDDRYDEWRLAVEASGVDASGKVFFPDGGSDGVAHMLQAIRDGGTGITAIICFDDQRAAAVLHQAVEMGISIPGEISITGYDDVATSRHLVVPLTTVSYAARDIAKAALDIIFGDEDGPQKRIIPVELIVRESTGPAKAGN